MAGKDQTHFQLPVCGDEKIVGHEREELHMTIRCQATRHEVCGQRLYPLSSWRCAQMQSAGA